MQFLVNSYRVKRIAGHGAEEIEQKAKTTGEVSLIVRVRGNTNTVDPGPVLLRCTGLCRRAQVGLLVSDPSLVHR